MKFVSTLLLLLGYVAHCLGAPCTADDLCADVPARVCDPADCEPVTQEQLIAIGYHFIRPLTWNKAPKPFVGYCPNKYTFNITKAGYNSNMLNVDVTLYITYGPSCNNVTISLFPFTAEEDPTTKKITILHLTYGDSKFEACIAAYDDATTSKILRLCRVDPPPPPGRGLGGFYAELIENATVIPDTIVDYITDNLDLDWAETVVECTM